MIEKDYEILGLPCFGRVTDVVEFKKHLENMTKGGFLMRRQKGHHYYRCTKKKGPCSERFFIREEALTNQLRQSLHRVSLPDGETEMMLAHVNKWRMTESAETATAIHRYKEAIAEVDTRIQRLTDLCVDGLISKEEFAARKEPLLHEKSGLREKMAAIESKDRPWTKLLENFIHDANQAGKAAFSETLSDLRDFHKKIGSNLVWGGPVSPTRQETDQRPSKERAIRQAPAFAETSAGRQRRCGAKIIPISTENPSPFHFVPDWSPKSHGSESFRKIRRKPVPILNVQFPGPWHILARRAKNQNWWRRGESNPRPRKRHCSFYMLVPSSVLAASTANGQAIDPASSHAQRRPASGTTPRFHFPLRPIRLPNGSAKPAVVASIA